MPGLNIHPSDIHERIERAMLIIQLTETAEHPTSMEQAWRVASGDEETDDARARRNAVIDKQWFKQRFGIGLIAALDAHGLGLLDFVARLKKYLNEPKRDKKGRILRDPDTGDPVPDLVQQHRYMMLYGKVLQMSGSMGVMEVPPPAKPGGSTDGSGERQAAKQIRDDLVAKGEAEVLDAP